MIGEEKQAESVDKKLFNLIEKPKRKTKRSFDKVVNKMFVNKSLSIKNLLIE